MSDTAILPAANGRAATTAALSPVGFTGVVQYGGIIDFGDYDRAWQGGNRDRTIATMLNDPAIGAALLAIEMLVRRIDWTVDRADDTPAAREAAEFVESCLDDMEGYWPGDTLARILTYLGWGWSCFEIVYKLRHGPDERDTRRQSRFSDGKIGWRSWGLRPQPTRWGWAFDAEQRDATGLIQRDPQSFKQVTIPLERCLLFRFGSRDNSPEGSTPLRVAYPAWYHKRAIQKIEGIGIERDLAGLPVMRVPTADILNNTPTFTRAKEIVTGVRNDSDAGLVLASDRDPVTKEYVQTFDLASTGGERAFDTDTVIRRYANEVVTVFLANVLRTGQDNVGAYALSETQAGLFHQAIGAHLDMIADTITQDGVNRLMRLNGVPVEALPRVGHDDIENVDLERVGMYLTRLATAGLLADTPELRAFVHEIAGLPVPPLEQLQREVAEREEQATALRARLAGTGDDGADDEDGAETEGAAADEDVDGA